MTTENQGLSRRTLAKGAAWAVPVVGIAAAVPAMAASKEVNTCGCKDPGNPFKYRMQYCFVNNNPTGIIEVQLTGFTVNGGTLINFASTQGGITSPVQIDAEGDDEFCTIISGNSTSSANGMGCALFKWRPLGTTTWTDASICTPVNDLPPCQKANITTVCGTWTPVS